MNYLNRDMKGRPYSLRKCALIWIGVLVALWGAIAWLLYAIYVYSTAP